MSSTIPIIISCYNNYKYLDNLIDQLVQLLESPDIRIFNNNSDEQNTLDYLSTTPYPVINSTSVPGPDTWIDYLYDSLPDVFAMVSPCVLFNPLMPNTFIDDLINIGNKYQSKKTGLALRIDDQAIMYQYSFEDYGYNATYQIYQSQLQYWSNPIPDCTYELFLSPLDSTFFVYNKNNCGADIRVAGNYTCRFLCWYVNIPDVIADPGSKGAISRYHRYLANASVNTYQAIKYFEFQYLTDQNIVAVTKRSSDFLVQLGSSNDDFWQNTYPSNWIEDTFDVLDRYLNINKQYLDIGGWIGDTAVYASRNSMSVVTVEPDQRVTKDLEQHISNNLLNAPVYVEKSAVGAVGDKVLYYTLGDKEEIKRAYVSNVDDSVAVDVISFNEIIDKYKLTNLSIINVNINGSEEYMLQDAYDYSTANKVPLYVTFYYSTWEDREIGRFRFLTEEQQRSITSGVVSILFNG